jgi:hypothetical protein
VGRGLPRARPWPAQPTGCCGSHFAAQLPRTLSPSNLIPGPFFPLSPHPFLPHPPPQNRRFQPVYVLEPDEASTLSILAGLKERYERHHRCVYSDEVGLDFERGEFLNGI